MKITIADFRAAGICPRARFWFEKQGLDWRSFARNGISLEALRATGDHSAQIDRLEILAKERESRGG